MHCVCLKTTVVWLDNARFGVSSIFTCAKGPANALGRRPASSGSKTWRFTSAAGGTGEKALYRYSCWDTGTRVKHPLERIGEYENMLSDITIEVLLSPLLGQSGLRYGLCYIRSLSFQCNKFLLSPPLGQSGLWCDLCCIRSVSIQCIAHSLSTSRGDAVSRRAFCGTHTLPPLAVLRILSDTGTGP